MLPVAAYAGAEDLIVGRSPGLTTSRSVRFSSGSGFPAASPVQFAKETASSSGGSRSGTPRRRQTGFREQAAPAASLAEFRQPSLEVPMPPPRGVARACSSVDRHDVCAAVHVVAKEQLNAASGAQQ